MDLTLNNLQRLICHKTQPTNKPISNNAEFTFMEKNFENNVFCSPPPKIPLIY